MNKSDTKAAENRHAAQRKILARYPEEVAAAARDYCHNCIHGDHPEIFCKIDLIPITSDGNPCYYFLQNILGE